VATSQHTAIPLVQRLPRRRDVTHTWRRPTGACDLRL